MKYCFFALIITALFVISSCVPSEQIVETVEPDEVIEKSLAPDWYHPSVLSSTDSTFFKGYSLAVAADSAEAIILGNNSALSNLQFEIDAALEKVRQQLAEQLPGSSYQEPSFIIKLRNLVQDLNLTDSDVTVYFEPEAGNQYYVYTRIVIPKGIVYPQVKDAIHDPAFLNKLEGL